MIRLRKHNRRTDRKRGASAVETALTLPIFLTFILALLEFGHVFFVSHMLKSAAKAGARYGSTLGVSNTDVTAKVQQIVGTAIKSTKATVIVRSASVFDSSTVNPKTINYSTLPTIDLTQCNQGDLYIVQVTVPYNSVALFPPYWVKNRTITGQSVMRHE